jgi:uncharacterized protein
VSEPSRTCLGCKKSVPKKELLRIVADAEKSGIVVDELGVLPGRGAYVHRGSKCLSLASRRVRAPLRLGDRVDLDAVGQVLAAIPSE